MYWLVSGPVWRHYRTHTIRRARKTDQFHHSSNWAHRVFRRKGKPPFHWTSVRRLKYIPLFLLYCICTIVSHSATWNRLLLVEEDLSQSSFSSGIIAMLHRLEPREYRELVWIFSLLQCQNGIRLRNDAVGLHTTHQIEMSLSVSAGPFLVMVQW